MFNTHVIQLTELNDLLDELPPGHIVRVATLDVTERTGDHGLRLAGLGVHVRAINEQGHVLACYVPVARLQMLAGAVLEDPGGENHLYDKAVDKAQDLAQRIRVHLTARGFAARPGVVDVGDTRPLAGSWAGDEASS